MANTIDRVGEHRQRMRENGFRQVNIQLHQQVIFQLDKLAKENCRTRAELISWLIQSTIKNR